MIGKERLEQLNKWSDTIIGAAIEVHKYQLMTYLKLTQKNLGLLINFNVPRLVNGITRRLYG